MKRIIYILLALALFGASCSEQVEEVKKAAITLADDQKIEMNVRPEGEIVSIKFHSTLEWTAQISGNDTDAAWLSIIPESGQGGDAVCKVKVEKNVTGLKRSVIIAITSHESNRKFKLIQNAIADNRNDDDDSENDDSGNEDPGTGNPGTEDPGNDDNPPAPSEPDQSGKYGWYELPAFSYKQSGSYMIDSSDSDLYYAHHICAGNEKGPGGKTARNYTVCFSAEHHCPVWVAAPRHRMYESGASRTDAYAKDPSIPSDIQYNSKSTGGGCNKGHMLGSAERLSSSATNKQVFYYSNIAPQYSDTFKTGGGAWNTLEDWVDDQVCSDTLYVVIGAYFDKYTDPRGTSASPKKISFGGRNDVSCPTMFYYILMRTKSGSSGKSLSECSASEIKCAAFVRSHNTPKKTAVSSAEMMSVSDLEKVTGFTYFPNVPHAPKDSFNASDWGL